LGAFVTTRLAHVWPQHLIALHLNLLPLPRNPAVTARNEQEQTYLTAMANWLKKDTAYIAIQATRPQTLALALNDSPAGLAAWIGEKFRTWSDPGTDLEKLFDIDALLANICLYWFTGSIGASFWPYHSRYYGEPIIPADAAIAVPTAYAEFPFEFLRPPQSMAGEMFANIRRWSPMAKGGHFAAMECPHELAADIIAFLTTC
jgi:microsomal epoxide hydrolase